MPIQLGLFCPYGVLFSHLEDKRTSNCTSGGFLSTSVYLRLFSANLNDETEAFPRVFSDNHLKGDGQNTRH